MKLAIRAAALAAAVVFSSAASAASTSGSLSFDWAAMTITNWFSPTVSTTEGGSSFDAFGYTGDLSQSDNGAQSAAVSLSGVQGTVGISGLSATATNGAVNLTSSFYKQINLTGNQAVYEVTLPYTFSFVASLLPGGGRASMNGDVELVADMTFANGSSQRSYTSLFTNFAGLSVETGEVESKSGSGNLKLLVASSASASSLYISATGRLGAAANTPMAPVPEPETYAMLLAGLGLIGAIARRRSAV